MKLQNIMGYVGYVQVVYLKMNNVTKLNVLMICDIIKKDVYFKEVKNEYKSWNSY